MKNKYSEANQNYNMHYSKQFIFYLTLIVLSSCTKETKEGETRNIKYLDERLMAFVPSFHEEYVKFDKNGKIWDGFYYTYFGTYRQDQNCTTNCQYIQSYAHYIRLNPSTLVSGITATSQNDTPYLEVRIGSNLNVTKMYLNSSLTDIDTIMTKNKNSLAQCSKFSKILVGGKTYYNVYVIGYTGWLYSFVYSKEYGIIMIDDNTFGHLEILK